MMEAAKHYKYACPLINKILQFKKSNSTNERSLWPSFGNLVTKS